MQSLASAAQLSALPARPVARRPAAGGAAALGCPQSCRPQPFRARLPEARLGAGRREPVMLRATPPVANALGSVSDDDDDDDDVRSPDGRPGAPPEGYRWRRVMLKISGEALAGKGGFGIDPDVVELFAAEVAASAKAGVQVAVVVGGGNFFRGKDREGRGLDRASADYMGMLATVMNAIQMQAAVEAQGVPTRVQTAIDMKEVAEPYIRRRAIRHLEKGRVVIFGAGTGNPFFTTDTGAALRAAEIGAEVLLKATKVDGVFDSDPNKNPGAKLLGHLTYQDVVVRQELGVMDTTAVTLCQENDIPVVRRATKWALSSRSIQIVFNVLTKGNIRAALRGDPIGTRVDSKDCGDAWECDVPPALVPEDAAAAQHHAEPAKQSVRGTPVA